MPPERQPNVWELDRRVRKLEREVAVALERIKELAHSTRGDEDRDSSASFSAHPGVIRLKLKGLPAWVYVVIFAILALVLLAIFGPVQGHHAPLPEAAGGFVPATE